MVIANLGRTLAGPVLLASLAALGLAAIRAPAGAEPPRESRDGEVREEWQWVDLPYAVTRTEYRQLLGAPPIRTAPGFRHSLVVPPGSQIYDAFDIQPYGQALLVGDDGKSGRLWKVTLDGRVSSVAAPVRWSPYTFDIAPAGFGKWRGQVFALAFNEPVAAGGWELPDAITRIDLATGKDRLVCYLPNNDENKPGAGGFFVRFGPAGGPFAGKLWITTASNHSIYQVTADGTCRHFVTLDLDKWGSPRGIGFTPDGQTMLLSTTAPEPGNRARTQKGGGKILRLKADGTVAGVVASGLHESGPFAYAPKGFGQYGGQLFITDAGDWGNDTGIVQSPNKGLAAPVPDDGVVYRVSADGKLAVVASGLRNPVGLAFAGNRLFVGDINGDFHVGYHKIRDGFIVALSPQP